MPIGLIGGLLGRAAGAGVIRGTVGKLLRKTGGRAATSPGTAVVRRPPNLPTLPRFPEGPGGVSVWGAGSGAAARGGRSMTRKAAEMIAAGIAFEAGGRIYNSITGKEIKSSRRMNPGNTRALKRSVRRINAAAKMYSKVLTAQKGKKCGGYTIKPKAGKRGCR